MSYLSRKIAQYISDDYATNFQEMFTWIYKEVSEIVHCELCTMHKCFIFFFTQMMQHYAGRLSEFFSHRMHNRQMENYLREAVKIEKKLGFELSHFFFIF